MPAQQIPRAKNAPATTSAAPAPGHSPIGVNPVRTAPSHRLPSQNPSSTPSPPTRIEAGEPPPPLGGRGLPWGRSAANSGLKPKSALAQGALARQSPTCTRIRPDRGSSPKRASASELGIECPHPRSAWAAPDHMRPGAAKSGERPQTKASGPWAYVITSGRPTEGEDASPQPPTKANPWSAHPRRFAARRASLGHAPRAGTARHIARTGTARFDRPKDIPWPRVSSPDGQTSQGGGVAGFGGWLRFASSPSPGLPGGNHMGPGAAGFALWSFTAFCGPWAHVMRRCPGRPRVRTLKDHLWCAGTLWASVLTLTAPPRLLGEQGLSWGWEKGRGVGVIALDGPRDLVGGRRVVG
jgi:hypothetical protein